MGRLSRALLTAHRLVELDSDPEVRFVFRRRRACYRLRRTAWGRGYATDGACALVDHAFGTVGLDRVWATTMTVNDGSRRVLTKAGLRHVRTETRAPHPPTGRSRDGSRTSRSSS